MTLEKRISLARTLTIIQLVLSGVIVLGLCGMGGLLLMSVVSDASLPPVVILVCMMLAMVLLAAFVLVLPWIVLTALKKRQDKWATAAFVSLILQIVMGGGLFAIFPIITLILLLNKEASEYIGMK